MDYQLVMQFSGTVLPEFDALVELEDELQGLLGRSAEVDGHDFGAGEANIFVLSSAPEQCFAAAVPLLKRKGLLSKGFKAAYRPLAGELYTVLWPESSGTFYVG